MLKTDFFWITEVVLFAIVVIIGTVAIDAHYPKEKDHSPATYKTHVPVTLAEMRAVDVLLLLGLFLIIVMTILMVIAAWPLLVENLWEPFQPGYVPNYKDG